MKRSLAGATLFLAVCLVAQGDPFVLSPSSRVGFSRSPFTSPAIFGPVDPAFYPSLSLADGSRFNFASSLGWMSPSPELLPATESAGRVSHTVVPPADPRSSLERLLNMRSDSSYVTGEVGFLYGQSSGKYGREYKQGYIMGEVGDDKFHISVGASYQDSNGQVPRFGR